MDDRRTVLPIAIARLIQNQKDHDIAGELRSLFDSGNRNLTIGLGPDVDIPLLDQELHAAAIAEIDRQVIVLSIHAEADGYMLERGESNFGLFVWTDLDPSWKSIPAGGSSRGLRPGDKIALGSVPADALQIVLPESSAVAPRAHRRSARLETAETQRRSRETPPQPSVPPPTTKKTPIGALPKAVSLSKMPLRSSVSPKPAPLRVDSDRYQRRFDSALKFWRYSMISVGSDLSSIILLDDPELASLRFALTRNLDAPERGYELFVKDPTPELWVQPSGHGAQLLSRGDFIKLKGNGNRLGFAGYLVHLADPAVPIARFATQPPTRPEIAEILGLELSDLEDPDAVKSAHRELVLRFHPDRHSGDPGHLSRFYEVQACFDAWKRSLV